MRAASIRLHFVMALREYDALAYNASDELEGSIRHVSKKARRVKGLEVVFDPKGHREYLTGFRKRKQQRRARALKEHAKKERQQRLQERTERRQKLRERLGVDLTEEVDPEEPDPSKGQEDVTVYNQGGVKTMVTTIALDPDIDVLNDPGDSEEDEEAAEVEENTGAPCGKVTSSVPHKPQSKVSKQPGRKGINKKRKSKRR